MSPDDAYKEQKVKVLHGKREKKPKKGYATWCAGDIEIDDDLCVHILNPYLVIAILEAIKEKGMFCMVGDDPSPPGQKINMVC